MILARLTFLCPNILQYVAGLVYFASAAKKQQAVDFASAAKKQQAVDIISIYEPSS
jgi:hypothetical protein